MTKALGPFEQAVIDLFTGKDPHAAWAAGMAHHLYLPAHMLFDPDTPGSGVAIVDPDLLYTRELAFDWLQEQRDALSILDIGSVDHHFEQQSQCIDQNVPFASRELFATIIAMRPAPLGGFHRLTVENGRTWGRLPSTLHPKPLPQRFHHPFPNAGVAPLTKVVIHGRPGGIFMGQQAPGPSTAQHIKDPIENLSHIHASRPPSCFSWGN